MNLDKFLKKEFIEVPDLGFGPARIMIRHGGNGFPLLLIHGNQMNQLTWHKMVPNLIKKHYKINSGHYVQEENPDKTSYWFSKFFD